MTALRLTAQRLREVLHYDAEMGVFTRKVRTAQRHQVGDRADFLITSGGQAGYRRVSIDSQRYLAHRVAWLYVYGQWPEHDIDHKDGDRSNNRITNLRDVVNQVNRENMRCARSDNKSGWLGVHLHDDGIRWRARIQVRGRSRHIGLYETPEDAYAAYVAVKRQLHSGCTL